MQWVRATFIAGSMGSKARLLSVPSVRVRVRVMSRQLQIRGIRYELFFECNQTFGSNVNVSGVMIKYKSYMVHRLGRGSKVLVKP